jgi:trk system potassium uptake protein
MPVQHSIDAARAFAETAVHPRHPARTLVLLFLIAILVGGVLLELPISVRGERIDLVSAFFTATSAVCVTGLVVTDTGTTFSGFGQAVILLLIQVGALGYMTASTILFVLLGRQPDLYSRLLLRDTLGQVTLKDTRRLLFQAVRFTLTVEVIGAALLTARFAQEPGRALPDALWRGVFHAVSAFCNAGFDILGGDVEPFAGLTLYTGDWVVNLTVMALVIVGGLGFPVCEELLRYRRGRNLSLHSRLVLTMTGVLIGAGTAIFLLSEWTSQATLAPLPLHQKALVSLFQSVTTRTAGFSTVSFGDLRSITLLMLGLFMFIGGSPGGTAGGVKTTTFAVMYAAVLSAIRSRPDAELFERRIPTETIYRGLVVFFLSFAAVVTGMFILTFTEPGALLQAGFTANLFIQIQFEAISAFGTVGLSTGVTPFLTDNGRLAIMALMFVGRLGPVTVATALARPGPPPRRRLPEERVALG